MFGGGGLNPRKMEQMMEQMGIDVEEFDASEAIIRLEDGTELVFENPDVTRMDAQGQQTYQVIGEPEEREAEETEDETTVGESDIPQEDVELVSERTGASEAEARAALERTDGDLAGAISDLE
ncbi:MAG: nascent polypeptide-associated complex protein [Halodesulfurarchaeum sp.]